MDLLFEGLDFFVGSLCDDVDTEYVLVFIFQFRGRRRRRRS